MIYTVTLNPAIDHFVSLPTFAAGGLSRAETEEFSFGGKGVNVSRVLKELDVPSVTLGFVAGFTGDALEAGLRAQGLSVDFLRVAGQTRVNTKISAQTETELNGVGPTVTAADFAALCDKVGALAAGDTLVLSGSLAKGLSANAYARLAAAAKDGVRVAVDTAGEPLKEALAAKPFLIKPNEAELRALCDSANGDPLTMAKRAQEMGARNVLVSRGAAGALLLTEDGDVVACAAPQGVVKSTVGAGDSLLAGFLAVLDNEKSPADALRFGVAVGSATAFSVGLAKKEDIDAVLAART